MRHLALVFMGLIGLLAACSSASEVGGSSSGSDVSSSSGSNPAQATDGVKNGSETDVDCGGGSTKKCADGKTCGKHDDCESGVCKGTTCAAPSADDGVKNGSETDVDCGGESGKKCASGKGCAKHEDCESDGCGPDKTCALARSCATEAGGTTCGVGSVDDANKKHESCCTALPVNNGGSTYNLDKYLITAGRMRQFIERTNGNLRAFASSLPEGGFIGWKRAWDDKLPETLGDALFFMGPAASSQTAGCDLGASSRGRTYWMTDEQNAEIDSGNHPAGAQSKLDAKILNCTPALMFYALCAWDGGRLPTPNELTFAWSAGEGRTFPWGDEGNDDSRSAFNYAHDYPTDLIKPNHWSDVPEPGRYPAGYGKFGHADLAGTMFQFTNAISGTNIRNLNSGSWQGHAIKSSGDFSNVNIDRTYWAFGARCVRPAAN